MCLRHKVCISVSRPDGGKQNILKGSSCTMRARLLNFLFGLYGLFGLMLCLGHGVYNFALMGNSFIYGMLTFTAMELTPLYILYLLLGFFMFFWVPYSFLGHFFMKYFTWHDIRWGDAPTINNPKLQKQLANNLNLPVSWRAPHVQGDGRKTWAEVATSNPDEK